MDTVNVRWGALLWLLLAGCGAQVSLRVSALPAGQQQAWPLEAGATLRSGDQLSLTVEVERPLYVYVMRVVGGHPPERLFPQGGDHLTHPGAPLQIPTDERRPYFQLDSQAGPEHLRLVFSVVPLSPDALQRELTRAGWREEPPPPPPEMPEKGRTGRAVRARLDRRGVATLQFSFVHK